MPTTPYAKLLVRVNAGAVTSGGVTVAVGDTIEFSAESTVGWGVPAPVWEIYGFPSSFALPAGWTSVVVDGTTVYQYTGLGPPPSFVATHWGKYMPALRVNGGGGQLTDETTALSAPSPSGLLDLGIREAGQFGGALKKWVRDVATNLRTLETFLASAVSLTGTAPVNVTKAAAAVGVGTTAARHDHKHDVTTAAASGITVGGTNAEGSATSLARSDHDHEVVRGTPVALGSALAAGASGEFADAAHVHTLADDMQWGAAVLTPSLSQADTAGATGEKLTIRAQNAVTTGGELSLEGGDAATPGFVTVKAGSVTAFQVSSTLITYSLLVRIPETEPTAVRHVGAEAGGRLRLYVGGAATSTVVESDATTAATNDKILRRGASAQGTVSWIEVGTDFATAGDIRGPNGFVVSIRNAANSNNINVIEGDSGTDDQITFGSAQLAKAIVTGGTNVELQYNATIAADFGANIGLFAAPSAGSGTGVLFVKNATANPSTNPTGGGILYADAGAGKWRGSGGTVTTFGPAEPHCPNCSRDFAHEWENQQTGEHLAVCMPCMLVALENAGIHVADFAFIKNLTQ